MSPRQGDEHVFIQDETINRNSYWPSQESRADLDSNYGCGDTVSVSELNDNFNNESGAHFPRSGQANIERCMSCISKLGAPSMSRSSTATGAGTPASGQPPNWSLLASEHTHQPINHAKLMQGLDRMSVCSSHGSYGSSGDSEYSVPRQSMCQSSDGWFEPSCHNCPSAPRPPPKSSKPAMPLPASATHVGPYENYDVPRTPVQVEPSGTSKLDIADLYDTPKKIHEYLHKDHNQTHHQNHSHTIDSTDKYGNYDMPTMCGCMAAIPKGKDLPRTNCTCNRVMSWADNWISLPYCRRGNGIEHTGVPINKVKLSGEGKMPVVQPSGELAIYATVDMAKKIRRKLLEGNSMEEGEIENDVQTCECEMDGDDVSSNYINLTPGENMATPPQEPICANYTNLEFALSLENYENAKEVLQKAGFTVGSLQETLQQCLPKSKLCPKCGHTSRKKKMPLLDHSNVSEFNADKVRNDKAEDYMLMEPGKSKRNLSGYLPMSPAVPPLPCKDLIRRLIAEKSASNPSLCGPIVDRSRKRSENAARVPGSCMMILHKSCASPSLRKQLLDNSDDLNPVSTTCSLGRKRASSVDSTRIIEDNDADCSDSVETLRRSSLNHIEGRRSSSPCIHQETEHCPDDSCGIESRPTESTNAEDDTSISTTTSAVTQSASVYIRRSASVPCKAQNRDSSSSNDSGVSTSSMRPLKTINREFVDFEQPLTTSFSLTSQHRHQSEFTTSVYNAPGLLPRRSKSFDPLRDINFQFKRDGAQNKCSSAEAEIPICTTKEDATSLTSTGGSVSGSTGPPFVDSRSTSSGTSDMSDYIETLSLSSHSSSDATGDLRYIDAFLYFEYMN